MDDMLPFRELLKQKKWYWDTTLDNLFEKSKQAIIQQIEKGVRSFELHRPTCLATDWSKDGVGFVLLQKFCRCVMDHAPNCCKDGWRIVYAGSRFTTPAESRYAPVEGEALAVTYALERCRLFVLGCPNLLIAVDHKPLIKILGDRSLGDIKNPRLFNLKEKTLMYSYKIKHVPGSWHLGPDACSRYPSMSSALQCFKTMPTDTDLDSISACHHFVESSVHASLNGNGYTRGIDVKVITWDRIKEASSQDTTIRNLVQCITNGFPSNSNDIPDDIKPYWKLKDELSHIDGVALYQARIIVPHILHT